MGHMMNPGFSLVPRLKDEKPGELFLPGHLG